MPIDLIKSRKYLKESDFEPLFIEDLGWDHYDKELEVPVDSKSFTLSAIAEKKGMVAFLCPSLQKGRIPDYATRRKIEKLTAKSVHEHIIIYTDKEKTTQIWQWVKRESGKPAACREHTYHQNQPGDSLLQKLQSVAFSIEEEEILTIVDVSGRARAAFDVEKVTKKFYDRFKKEHDAFLKFITGIPDDDLHTWYASVMLNRIMFIYFVQKKGFLDGDTDYLRKRLEQSMKQGNDLFYKEFLSPLFFEGFAKKEEDRSAKMNRLLGDVPYLNGGLFLKHQIEELHGKDIQITDKAFQKLFDFFDQYQWHLDERPLKKDNEINPDVLGYIFEKYINQKQMGAYYTKEDITEYISKNTVIPYLFDAAKKKCKIAFLPVRGTQTGEGEQSIWKLLQSDPDRYIYDAVQKGVDLELPEDIAVGIRDVSKRTEWNKPASSEFALPTEIWREVVARRQRYEEVKSKMEKGDIRSINDLITYNLDIRQFAQDVIWNSEGPELLRAFYHAIEKVTVLDPTCGSGAFLFAALNILEPLYEACLDRMQVFVDELEMSEKKHRKDKYGDFKEILKKAGEHPNLKYFIFKSIIVNNLYGVDIMEEAIEICKLRLFLKLVAQIDSIEHIEPLPDIDFNIRAGNTLVGFATYDEAEKVIASKLDFDNTMDRIKEQAEDIDRLFQLFHKQQTELGGEVAPEDKQALKDKLKVLEDELNQYLAGEYGIDPSPSRHSRAGGNPESYRKWLKSHHPFHWFIEFYGIINSGGFDVIIGNPPFVEYKSVTEQYRTRNFHTDTCGNLYAFVVERSFNLAKHVGRIGLIVPISLMAAQRMAILQDLIISSSDYLTLANFGLRPAALFPGIMQRLTICIALKGIQGAVLTSDYITWYAEEREILFSLLRYFPLSKLRQSYSIPKINNSCAHSALFKILSKPRPWSHYNQFKGNHRLFYHNAGGYWIKTFDFKPYYKSLKHPDKNHTTISELNMPSRDLITTYLGILNSSLFYFFWKSLTDARHVYPSDIVMLPIELPLKITDLEAIGFLGESLMDAFKKNKKRITYGKAEVDQFTIAPSKTIIDEIDRVLAKHYGFTDEELDFIINYDIKYRMGIDS